MQKIAILTDTASDLTDDLLERYNILTIPFRIIYSDREYEDRIDITPNEVFKSFEKEIPTTSLPNMEKLDNILCRLEEENYTHVIAIHLSSNLSGAYNSVRLALEDHPKLESFVYDTATGTIAEGCIALSAAKQVEEGKSFEEIINSLPNLRKNIHTYLLLNTLEHVIKGGRIGKVAGTVGELLNIKPIIKVGDDGILHTHLKVRGRKQSISKLICIIKEHLEKSKCNIWLVEGFALEEINLIRDKIKDFKNINQLDIITVGPALSVHSGPGLVGAVIEEVQPFND